MRKDVDSHLKYKILKDNESGLIFAHGSTVGSFYYVVIFIGSLKILIIYLPYENEIKANLRKKY